MSLFPTPPSNHAFTPQTPSRMAPPPSDTESDHAPSSFPSSLAKRPHDANGRTLVDVKKERLVKQSKLHETPCDRGSVSTERLGFETSRVAVAETPPSLATTLHCPHEPTQHEATTTPVERTPLAVSSLALVRPRKGRRVRKTNVEKMEILAFVDQGGSQGAAAEKFGVSRTAVTKMVKERAAIAAQALVESATSSRKVLQYQHKLSVIEDMLYKWQMQMELDAPTLKITGEVLQSKAMEFRNKILADYSHELADDVVMSLTDFKASNGWLHRYMQRRSMRALPKLPGPTGRRAVMPPDQMNDDQRIQTVRDLLLTVSPACIWNLDELILRHRTTSSRLDSVVNMDARSLERISVAMALSASGEKLHLQVVGKDPNPDALRDIDTLTSYGVQYRDQCRAAHDAHTIADFIQAMNQEAATRKQVWYLVLDSCTAHVAAAHALNPSGSFRNGFRLESIVLLFMPPGPSGDAQPLHQGILRSFKLHFRRAMLQTLLHEHEQWAAAAEVDQQSHNIEATSSEGSPVQDVFDVHAHTHLRNTLIWLQKAWESVPQSLIRQAWSASLYLPAVIAGDGGPLASMGEEDEIKVYTELLNKLTRVPALQRALGLDFTDNSVQFMMELLDFDKPEATGADEITKDNEIVVESLASQGLLRETQRALTLDSIKSDDLPLLTASEAHATVSRLLHFVSHDNNNLLTLSERRTGRANLLILQRLLSKVRERERERESTTDFTV